MSIYRDVPGRRYRGYSVTRGGLYRSPNGWEGYTPVRVTNSRIERLNGAEMRRRAFEPRSTHNTELKLGAVQNALQQPQAAPKREYVALTKKPWSWTAIDWLLTTGGRRDGLP